MTIRDLLTDFSIHNKYGDMDVYNDCIDECAPAWCGNLLTDKGEEHFDARYEGLLDTEIEVGKNMCGSYIDCKINHLDDCEERWDAIAHLFECLCGYCSEDEYDLWFADYGDWDQVVASLIPKGDENEDVLNRIAVLEARLETALTYTLNHICEEDIPQFVKTIKEA